MPIVGGLDIHRKQITFDYLDTVTGEVKRGQITPADRQHVRAWLARFAGCGDVAFAVEGCAGWRYVAEELAAAGIGAHLGVQLWMPKAGGRVSFAAEGDEQLMLALGVQSKREITRTRIRVRTAMAAQARDQGRYLGGRPPYGYRLADAGPHPNKAHAAWGRWAHRLEPDPHTAPVVRWMFAQR